MHSFLYNNNRIEVYVYANRGLQEDLVRLKTGCRQSYKLIDFIFEILIPFHILTIDCMDGHILRRHITRRRPRTLCRDKYFDICYTH